MTMPTDMIAKANDYARQFNTVAEHHGFDLPMEVLAPLVELFAAALAAQGETAPLTPAEEADDRADGRRAQLMFRTRGIEGLRAYPMPSSTGTINASDIDLKLAQGETAPAQRFYDVTTRLISWSPHGRIEEGATQEYHDALVALMELRRELRDSGAVTHNESCWRQTGETAPPETVRCLDCGLELPYDCGFDLCIECQRKRAQGETAPAPVDERARSYYGKALDLLADQLTALPANEWEGRRLKVVAVLRNAAADTAAASPVPTAVIPPCILPKGHEGPCEYAAAEFHDAQAAYALEDKYRDYERWASAGDRLERAWREVASTIAPAAAKGLDLERLARETANELRMQAMIQWAPETVMTERMETVVMPFILTALRAVAEATNVRVKP